jgi:SSS family solute:Na+ symporter
MLAPGVFLAFLWRRTSAIGVLAGIAAGYAALLAPQAEAVWTRLVPDWDRGLVAMLVNATVVVLVSAVRPASPAHVERQGEGGTRDVETA